MEGVLVLVAVMCGAGWLISSIGKRAMILFVVEKEYTLPTDEEMKACAATVLRRMMGIVKNC